MQSYVCHMNDLHFAGPLKLPLQQPWFVGMTLAHLQNGDLAQFNKHHRLSNSGV